MTDISFQEKLYHLAVNLLDGTIKGTIKWSETAEEESFRTVLNTGLVRIEREVRQQRGLPFETIEVEGGLSGSSLSGGGNSGGADWDLDSFEYVLVVLDAKNKEIGRYLPDRPERKMTLRNLWELASRSARNAEQTIDSLLKEVEGKTKHLVSK